MWCYKLVQRMSVGCQSCKSWGFGAFCILCKKLTGIQYFANDKKWWRNVREIRPWSLFERFNSFSVHVLKLELEDVLRQFHIVFFNWTKKKCMSKFILETNCKSIQNIVCSLLMIQRLHIHECGTDGIHGEDWFFYRPFLLKLEAHSHSTLESCLAAGE